MLIPASPRIAASFASSPGLSGTSTSSWITRVDPGRHGVSTLQGFRAVARRRSAYRGRPARPSDSHAVPSGVRRDPGAGHGPSDPLLHIRARDAVEPATIGPRDGGRVGRTPECWIRTGLGTELVPGRIEVLQGAIPPRG